MLESAFCAPCKPAQEAWLNDLSSRPPVSTIMQAEKELAPADFDPPPPPPFPFPALAHAAVSSASTLRPAAALNVPLTVPPLRGRLCCRRNHRPMILPDRPRHKEIPRSPPRMMIRNLLPPQVLR